MLPMFMSKPFDVQYFQHIRRLFGTSLIGYWPLWEASGATATDISPQGNNGTYSNVTLGQAGIGDGRTSGQFLANGYVDVYSAGLATDFNGAEGTFAIWAKVGNAGIWTDGAYRDIVRIGADAGNRFWIRKTSNNNELDWLYQAGGGVKELLNTNYAVTTWQNLGLTWSASGDAVKAYAGGSQVGATMTGLGTWVGTLAATDTNLGCHLQTGEFWSGYLAHAILLNRVATAQEMTEVARISI